MEAASETIWQTIDLCFEYPVCFTAGLFSPKNPLFVDILSRKASPKPHRLFFILDEGVVRSSPHLLSSIEQYLLAHAGALSAPIPPLIVPGGEAVKNQPDWVHTIHEAIHQAGFCRHSFVIAIGGGAVLDMVGFACATPHRGLRLVRVPTTVLAQNDAGIGIKNAINAFGQKNFLGVFAPPFAVINDQEFLTTLAQRDWIAGLAEAVKVALLKDHTFFAFLVREAQALVARDAQAMSHAIRCCAGLHLAHIRTSGDPLELGSARPLDFGHWSAHKLETLSHYSLRHGEAVACGIALDTYYSFAKGWLSREDMESVLQLLQELTFTLYQPEMEHLEFLHGLQEFQEHLGGTLNITLLKGIGQKIEVQQMDAETIAFGVAYLKGKSDPRES